MRVISGWEPDKPGSLGSHHRELEPLCSAPAYETLFHSTELPLAGIPHHTLQCPGTLVTCRNFPFTPHRHTAHLQEFPTDSIPAHSSPAGISHWQHTGTSLTCRICCPFLKLVKARITSWLMTSSALFQSLLKPRTICCTRAVDMTQTFFNCGISVHMLWVFQYTHCEHDTNSGISVHMLCTWHKLWYFSTHTVNMTQTLVFQYVHAVDMTDCGISVHTRCEHDTNSCISVYTLWTWHKLWYFSTHAVNMTQTLVFRYTHWEHDANCGISVHMLCT